MISIGIGLLLGLMLVGISELIKFTTNWLIDRYWDYKGRLVIQGKTIKKYN